MKGKRAAPGPAESVRHRLKADVGLACSVRPGAALETGTVLPHVTGAKVPAPPARELRVVPRKVCLSSQLVGRKGFFIAQTGKRSWTMKSLEERDRALIEAAGAAIRRNYDGENFHHTVGAAVRCGRRSLYRRECVLHSRRMRRAGGHRLRHHQWRAGFGSNRRRPRQRRLGTAAPVRQLPAAPGGLRAGV